MKNKIVRDSKGRFVKGGIPWSKGKHIWENKKHPKGTLGKHWELSEKARENISLAKMGEKNPNYGKINGKDNPMFGVHRFGKDNPFYGKHHTKETLEKRSKKVKEKGIFKGKNNPMYGIHRFKEENPFYGKKHTLKTINKFKAKEFSEETRKKMRTARIKLILPFKDTSIEIKIQDYLKLLHVEFMTHYYMSEIAHAYQCDIFIPKQENEGIIISQKTIIECDGCYWHGCKICNKYFNNLQEEHIKRDKIRTSELINKGYKVIRLWEHNIKKMELNDFKDKLI